MNFLQELVANFRQMIDPLVTAVAGDSYARNAVLQAMALPPSAPGGDVPLDPSVLERIEAFRTAEDPDLVAFLSVADDIIALAANLRSFVSAATTGPDPGARVIDEAIRQLFDSLALNWVRHRYPTFYASMRLCRVVEEEAIAGRTETFFAERLINLVVDGARVLREAYFNWTLNDEADAERLSHALFIPLIGIASAIDGKINPLGGGGGDEKPLRTFYGWDAPPSATPVADRISDRTLTLAFGTKIGQVQSRLSITSILIPAEHGGPALLLSFGGGGTVEHRESDGTTLKLGLSSSSALSLLFRGITDVTAEGPSDAKFEYSISRAADATRPPSRVVFTPNTRFEFGRVGISTVISTREADIKVSFQSAVLLIGASEVDSFANSQVASSGFRANFNLTLGISTAKGGPYIDAGAGLSAMIPLNLALGPVHLHTLLIEIRPVTEGVRFNALLSMSFRLGPFSASVEGIGVGLDATAPSGPRNLGFVHVTPRFVPPRGVGLVLDAGCITGGGFISFDPDNGRYSGVIQLLFGWGDQHVTITAFILIDTRLPDGEGFSFLVLAAAEWDPGWGPVLGFTMNGFGLLGGMHRTIVTDAIQSGLRRGTLDSILFPRDAVRNAPQIVSDLRTVFPPERHSHVFGLMLKLRYGALLDIKLGVILKLTAPRRLVILGQVTSRLPLPETAVVEIHVDILGVIDFAEPRISIDGSLHDSRVGPFAIYGDFAFRFIGGSTPLFAASIGGLHPQFSPPPAFPALRRVTIALGSGANPRVSLQAYLAITSNTFQIGARAEVYASAAGFSVHGWLGFDALVTFDPFGFVVDVFAGVELKRGNTVIAAIHLSGTLSGPGPWDIQGRACLSLFFFDICVPVRATIGDSHREGVIATQVWQLVQQAVSDPANWRGQQLSAADALVTIRPPAGTILVSPVGELTLQQQVAPLDRAITRFGQGTVEGPNEFRVRTVTIGSDEQSVAGVDDFFAAAQFVEMTDAEKLSRPSFEKMQAGFTVPGGVRYGAGVGTDVEYDTTLIDSPWDLRPAPPYVLPAAVQLAALSFSALTASTLNDTGLERFGIAGVRTPLVALADDAFVIADAATLEVQRDFGTLGRGAALDAVRMWEAAHPGDRGRFEVISRFDLEDVA